MNHLHRKKLVIFCDFGVFNSKPPVLYANTPKPLVIVTPLNISHVQATIRCSKTHGLQIRTRSGGHDFEGLSYVSEVPFVVVDLVHFRSIDVDVENQEAWVQSGAITVVEGTVYCSENGLAGDNVLDAQLVDATGVLDRRSMGEDLFWAIRGAAEEVRDRSLVESEVGSYSNNRDCFLIGRTLEQNATELLHRWQYVAPNLPNDVYSVVSISTINGTATGTRTVLATFTSVFQGSTNELMALMQERFPELGLVRENFIETTWIESLMLLTQLPNETSEILLDRTYRNTLLSPAFKAKSDYVRKPMPEIALQGLWSQLLEDVATTATMNIISYGGKMDEIPESALPFPHRKGTLYKINYNIGWQEEENNNPQRYKTGFGTLSVYGSIVSKSPREAYINYRDLDIGRNDDDGKTSYKQASVWGRKYFKRNFNRLVMLSRRSIQRISSDMNRASSSFSLIEEKKIIFLQSCLE
ncbi:FAD-binding Berberine family protein [Hibiscus syriacus]|uniref:FAD-binding Berberine family protein n=1 Tax=Hibiscus syriacus TaxID=106335 RepID=A0A6A3D3U7_HIBSY|nr:FAD-binding Berberine family protein [Hibiscus syriacus]